MQAAGSAAKLQCVAVHGLLQGVERPDLWGRSVELDLAWQGLGSGGSSGRISQLCVTIGSQRWRMRGLERNEVLFWRGLITCLTMAEKEGGLVQTGWVGFCSRMDELPRF